MTTAELNGYISTLKQLRGQKSASTGKPSSTHKKLISKRQKRKKGVKHVK